MRVRTSVMHGSALAAALMLLACGGNEAPKPEMAAPVPNVAGPVPVITAPVPVITAPVPATDTRAHAPATSASPPTLALQVVRSKAGVGLRVINADRRTVSLAAQVTLEAVRGASAVAVPNQSLVLQLNCKSSGCVTLAPGAEIDAPAWLEQIGGERCGALLVPPAAGRYRLRVQSCDAAHSREVELAWPAE